MKFRLSNANRKRVGMKIMILNIHRKSLNSHFKRRDFSNSLKEEEEKSRGEQFLLSYTWLTRGICRQKYDKEKDFTLSSIKEGEIVL